MQGTVFVVGELAERRPDLVLRCRDAGHEIGLHGYRHVPIDELGEQAFRQDVSRGRDVLEHITGEGVTGYRAPLFSITPSTAWAPGILTGMGFRYSSSVLPTRSPIRGFPGAPHRPFRWSCGLVELPCPIGGIGAASIPYLGGVYLRYLPMVAVRTMTRRHSDLAQWLYCHPYDVDDTGRTLHLPHAGMMTTRILGWRRRGTPRRIADVLGRGPAGVPLRVVADRCAALPHFDYPTTTTG